jgi:hypothetical protein
MIKCPSCNFEGEPIVKKALSTQGWILFVVLLLLCFPLCWLPFVMDKFKEEQRKCSKCGTKIVVPVA